jgi:RNAse (barnase) inhibitor barstar
MNKEQFNKLFWKHLAEQKKIHGDGMDAEIMALGLAEKELKERLDIVEQREYGIIINRKEKK